MPSLIEIRLLGGFALNTGDTNSEELSLSRREGALLAYLILFRDSAQSRRQVAFQFWPESSDGQARTNLRQLLHRLLKTCPQLEPYLFVGPKTLKWKGDSGVWVDVAAFEALLAQAAEANGAAETVRLLRTAVSQYRGDLLPDLYDEWLDEPRRHLQRVHRAALQKLYRLLGAARRTDEAVAYARQLIALEPLDEAAYRDLMTLQALAGDRAGALQTFQNCAAVLREDLGLDPEQQTQALSKRIAAGDALGDASAAAATGETLPLIGRAREWAVLMEAWQRALKGQVQLVLVRGEAGIGKSRLLEEMARWAGLQGAAVAQTRVYEAHTEMAYAPLAAWLRSAAYKEAVKNIAPVWQVELARLLPEISALNPQLPLPNALTDSLQRQHFYDALARVLLMPAADGPLVLVLDDLQWCDLETLAWLNYLLPAATDKPLLLLTAVRSGTILQDHPLLATLATWRREGRLTEIRPRPLDEAETARLAASVASRDLTAVESEHLVRETEGNPLFIVEYTRAALEDVRLLESRTADGASVLPPRVQAVFEARLRAVPSEARVLLELAAVMGRQFSVNVLLHAAGKEEEWVIDGLDDLLLRRLIREQEDDTYDFSHEKLRAVTYGQISAARRRLLHRRVAEAMEAVFAADTGPVAAWIAAHFERAGQPEQAITYLQQAAVGARQIYANADAALYLRRALGLLEGRPSGPLRDRLELSILAALGPALVALESYGAHGVIDVYEQMLRLCDRLGLAADPRALRGLAIGYVVLSRQSVAAGYAEQLLARAQVEQDEVLLAEGNYAVGVSAFWQGDFARSKKHLEQALAHYKPEQRAVHIKKFAQDPGVICLSRLALTLWFLGYPDSAWQTMARATNGLHMPVHPFSQAYAHLFAAMMAIFGATSDEYEREIAALRQIMANHNFAYTNEFLRLHQGHLLDLHNEPEEASRQIRRQLQAWQAADHYLLQTFWLAELAKISLEVSRPAEALRTLEEALEFVQQTGESFYEAEIYRLIGLAHILMGSLPDLAAEKFRLAIDVARRQQARMLELGALTDLCRLWSEAGAGDLLTAARLELAACYRTFAEGMDTPQLAAAREMLGQDV